MSGVHAPPPVVVMGVSAAGKTTVAQALSARLRVPWRDADDLHPAANVAKMADGVPLTDDDRWPWLDTVGAVMAAARPDGMVMACSALRRVYRDRLRAHVPDLVFVHLDGTRDLLAVRAAARTDHYMPASLLPSQLATLQPLADGERGVAINVNDTVDAIADKAMAWLRVAG